MQQQSQIIYFNLIKYPAIRVSSYPNMLSKHKSGSNDHRKNAPLYKYLSTGMDNNIITSYFNVSKSVNKLCSGKARFYQISPNRRKSWVGSNDYQNAFDLESWRFETDKTDLKFRLIKLIPECCIQVIFGLIVGAIIHFSSSSLESSILSLFTVSTN